LILVAALTAPLLIPSKRKHYNVYNFLLLGLGVLDFTYAMFQVVDNSLMITNQSPILPNSPSFQDDGYNRANIPANIYITANMFFNCLICHQIWVLLTSSRRATRIKLPDWTSMILKILAVYFLSILSGVIELVVRKAARRMYYDGDDSNVEKSWKIQYAMNFFMFVTLYIGICYVLCVTILVWYRGYIPKASGTTSPKDKALRELSTFFFRIIGVFLGIWLPGVIMNNVALGNDIYLLWQIANWTIQTQAIVTFFILLTKSDLRKYIFDLVTLSYQNCFCATKADGSANVKDCNVLQSGKPLNRVNEVSNNTDPTADTTVRTVDISARDSLGSKSIKSRVSSDKKIVGNSKDLKTMDEEDEERDEETGVDRFESSTRNAESGQLGGNNNSIA